MDLLKAQLARLQQQLSGLTSSQKMLAGALVAIMAMTLFWWGRYAGEAQSEPLLNQSFSADDIAQITSRLATKNIQYTVSGDRIMIPADRKLEILGDLGFAHLLPKRTSAGFDEITKQMTPWDSADKTNQLWVVAKQRTLEAVIENFPDVREAAVVIDPHDERRFDGHDVYPSAMVYITTNNRDDLSRNVRQLAMSAADVVAGAEAGLSRAHVTVVIDGATITIPDKNAEDSLPGGDTYIEAIRQNEEMLRDKIRQQLGFIPGLFVSVRVDLNTKKVQTQETKVDAKASAHLTQSEEEHTTESTGPAPSVEPGAAGNVSNTPLAVGAGAASGGSTSNETESKVTYQNLPTETVQTTVQGPGDATAVSASVRVPRSFFIATYKDLNKGAEPDDAALKVLVTDELGRIRSDVKSCTGIKTDDAVTVNWYSDSALALAAKPVSVVSAASPVTTLVLSHVRDIGVGGLAVVSLFMVMMMVRKSSPSPMALALAPDPAAEKASIRLQGESQLAGEVSEGDKSLDGVELDPESIKTQQVIDQVSDMVTENPDAAANLVKRWMNRTQ